LAAALAELRDRRRRQQSGPALAVFHVSAPRLTWRPRRRSGCLLMFYRPLPASAKSRNAASKRQLAPGVEAARLGIDPVARLNLMQGFPGRAADHAIRSCTVSHRAIEMRPMTPLRHAYQHERPENGIVPTT